MKSPLCSKDEEKILLDTINRKGFMLEEKTIKIIKNLNGIELIHPRKGLGKGKDRIEIDVLFHTPRCVFVVECKKTEYSWIFPKEIGSPNSVVMVYHSPDGIKPKQRRTSDIESVTSDIDVVIDAQGKLERNNKKRIRTASNDVNKGIRQALKEMGAALGLSGIQDKKIYAILVSNAKLYMLDYNSKKIDARGNLTDFSQLRPVDFIAYNFPEEIYEGSSDNPIRKGRRKGKWEMVDNTKTVFVTNIESLENLIILLRDWDV